MRARCQRHKPPMPSLTATGSDTTGLHCLGEIAASHSAGQVMQPATSRSLPKFRRTRGYHLHEPAREPACGNHAIFCMCL
jgi:hypothetical protein